MKKIIRILIILLVLAAGGYFVLKSISGKSTYNSLYLIPDDASVIIESNNIFNAWDAIIHSDAWYHLKNIESLHTLDYQLQSIDSTISGNKLLFKLLGKRRLMLSYHHTQSNKYDFLIVTDIGKATRIKNIPGLLKNILGDNINVSSRTYNNEEVIEIHDKASGKLIYMSMLHDKALVSFSFLLIEKAIDEQANMTLARDLNFLEVYEKTSGKGLFNVFLQHQYFLNMLNNTAGVTTSKLSKQLKDIYYTGLFFDISKEGLLTLEGFSSYDDTKTTMFGILDKGSPEVLSSEIIPQQIASMLKINIDNPIDYFHASLKQGGEESYNSNIDRIEKLEKRLKIDVEENLLSWIEKEIVLVQTKPSNLGKANEFAIVLHGKNEKLPRKNLQLIYDQIDIKTPVDIKHTEYQGYDIAYISFPGLLKVLFGGLLDKIEKPYFTQIKNQVIISNHPQTLKNIIDDYINQQTLESNMDYYNFQKQFNSGSSISSYFDVPVLFTNLREYFTSTAWTSLNKNKEYITSFSNAGLFLSNENNLFHFEFKAQYKRETEQYKKQNYSITDIFTAAVKTDTVSNYVAVEEKELVIEQSKISIADLDASKHDQYFSDSTLQLTVQIKNGLKDGSFKEYYSNGNIKIRGKFKNDKKHGKWKYYSETGELAYEKEYKNGELIKE